MPRGIPRGRIPLTDKNRRGDFCFPPGKPCGGFTYVS
nr:MAG TPA: hypothetical protein [Bacteriophage sp.]